MTVILILKDCFTTLLKTTGMKQSFFNAKLVELLSQINLLPEIVSTGGTPNLQSVGKLSGSTEHRAGTCVFNDLMMIKDGFATIDDCALRVYTPV